MRIFFLKHLFFQKSEVELEIEEKQKIKKANSKSGKVYDKLRQIYDQEMSEMSETWAL